MKKIKYKNKFVLINDNKNCQNTSDSNTAYGLGVIAAAPSSNVLYILIRSENML